jgi:hypothetical protein
MNKIAHRKSAKDAKYSKMDKSLLTMIIVLVGINAYPCVSALIYQDATPVPPFLENSASAACSPTAGTYAEAFCTNAARSPAPYICCVSWR